MALQIGVFNGVWLAGAITLTILWWYTSLISIVTVIVASALWIPFARQIADDILTKQWQGAIRKDGAYVLITGASRGIGSATALRLLRSGFNVIAGVRRDADGKALLEQVQKTTEVKGKLSYVLLDVTDQASVDQAVVQVGEIINKEKEGDGLYALVNNAGMPVAMNPIEGQTLEVHDQVMQANFFGVVRVTKAFLPLLFKSAKTNPKRRARIVNVSSVAAIMASALGAPYAASKSAMEAWSDSLRPEVEALGVDVVILEPGMTTTDMFKDLVEESNAIEAKQRDWAEKGYADYSHVLPVLRLISTVCSQAVPTSAVADMMTLALSVSRRDLRTRYINKKDLAIPLMAALIPTRVHDWLLFPLMARATATKSTQATTSASKKSN